MTRASMVEYVEAVRGRYLGGLKKKGKMSVLIIFFAMLYYLLC